jgi:hypothetical protein
VLPQNWIKRIIELRDFPLPLTPVMQTTLPSGMSERYVLQIISRCISQYQLFAASLRLSCGISILVFPLRYAAVTPPCFVDKFFGVPSLYHVSTETTRSGSNIQI